MTDKERILMMIVTRIIPGIMYSPNSERDAYVKGGFFGNNYLSPGDLVYAQTSIDPNDFMVGFVHEVADNSVVIREIGSNRLCNYSNEAFAKINKEKLGYEVLEGLQYKTYRKVLKAFSSYCKYGTRFKSISFSDGLCKIEGREMFKEETIFDVSIPYNSKTSIKSIGEALKKAENGGSND